jgi:type II secretory pathway component PulF
MTHVSARLLNGLPSGTGCHDRSSCFPNAFDDIYVNSVAAGEVSGTLDALLETLAEFMEADIEVRGDVKSALMYPGILVSTLGGAITVLMVFVVPRFTVLYSDMGSDLPLPILDGLSLIAKTTRNNKIRGKLEELADAVACGETLSAGMQAVECFDPAVRQLIETGEVTGSLKASCRTVAVQLKKDLSYLTRNLSTFIAPVMTLGLAVIVLFVALATFLPMWDMASAMK